MTVLLVEIEEAIEFLDDTTTIHRHDLVFDCGVQCWA